MKTLHKLILILVISVIILKSIQYYLILPRTQTTNGSTRNDPAKIIVSVYYEALCPDSRRFFVDQLLPAYELIPDSIELDLVPYGKANTKQTDGRINFSCQHGPTECLANKIHACVIDSTRHDQLAQLRYIACMIDDNYNPEYVGKKCGDEAGVDYGLIRNCSEGEMGNMLLKSYGERTKALRPRVTFIPTVELDGKHTVPQDEVLQNFMSEICKALIVKPVECF